MKLFYLEGDLKSFALLWLGIIISGCTNIGNISELESPDGQVQVKLLSEGGKIEYQVLWQGREMIRPSGLSILPDETAKITGATVESVDQSWKTVWGQFSEIRDNYNVLTLNLEFENVMGKLYVRAYDQGLAFRYELTDYEEGKEAVFQCEYNLANEDMLYAPDHENEPLGPLQISELVGRSTKTPGFQIPVVVERADQKHMAFLESDLYSAQGFEVMDLGFNMQKGVLVSTSVTTLKGDKMITPWRVILLNETVGDLVTNTVAVNLAAPCEIEDPKWVKPGKAVWDWRVHGYEAPDGFVYGIDTESYLRFIDFAAEKRIEYFLIDDSWYDDVSTGHIEMSEKLDLAKVTKYALEKGVDLILYYDRRQGDYGDKALFPYYQSMGMKGIKYGFMGSNVPFSRNAIRASAKSELLINFHDGPVPFTGIRRTFPNAITREYCHAQQDSRRVFTPESFIKMALINAIQGPLDMNNGNFDITGINAGGRQKGPKKLNTYFTTATAEAARTLIIFSGLVCIPDAPEAYNAKSDLFEFIQKQPVGKWDESMILHSKMGEYMTTARRHENEWFIGSVSDQQVRTLSIPLDFLKDEVTYKITYYEDTNETDCKTNPEAYQVRTGTVKKGDIIEARMASGGGHCMWIRPE